MKAGVSLRRQNEAISTRANFHNLGAIVLLEEKVYSYCEWFEQVLPAIEAGTLNVINKSRFTINYQLFHNMLEIVDDGIRYSCEGYRMHEIVVKRLGEMSFSEVHYNGM
jgi:hypothetical protein